jgi:hypothetical protein
VAHALSQCTPVRYGRIASISVTYAATKFVGPHKSYMHQYIIELAHRGQTIGPYLTQVGATTFRALNMKIDHTPTFPSSILHFPLITLPSLKLCQHSNHST